MTARRELAALDPTAMDALRRFFAGGAELAWQDSALCAQTDPDAFFPEKGGSTKQAKEVCRGCEVRTECLEYAFEHAEKFGIWGGLSEQERRDIKYRRAPMPEWARRDQRPAA